MFKFKSFACLAVCLLALSARAQPPASALKILTFNTWLPELYDLKLASHASDRRELMAQDLRTSGADVLNLIEVWQPKNAAYLIQQLRDIYPYCSYDPDHTRNHETYSNGLLIFSKWPLKNDGFHYPTGCTRPLQAIIYSEITRKDEHFVSKGAIHNVMIDPALGPIDLFSSHLGALTFSKQTDDYNPVHKEIIFSQANELTAFVDSVSETPSQFLMMDSNRNFRLREAHVGYTTDLDPSYALFLSRHFEDSFMTANHFEPHTLANLYTFDMQKNPNAGGGAFTADPSDFIDYIFVRSQALLPDQSEMVFTAPQVARDGRSGFLSDHFGIVSTFKLSY